MFQLWWYLSIVCRPCCQDHAQKWPLCRANHERRRHREYLVLTVVCSSQSTFFFILASFLFSFWLYPHWILLENGLFFSILLHVETTWRINLFSWIFYSSFFCLPSLFLPFNVFNRCSSIILTTFFGYKNQDQRHFISVTRKAYRVTMNVKICVKGKKHEHNRLY